MKFNTACSVLLVTGLSSSMPVAFASSSSLLEAASSTRFHHHQHLRSLQTDLGPMDEGGDEFPEDSLADENSNGGSNSSDDGDEDDNKSYEDPDIVRSCTGGIDSTLRSYKTKCKAETIQGNMEIEDTTKYTVETSNGGITIEMKYESEMDVDSNSLSESASTDEEDEGSDGEGDNESESEEDEGDRRRLRKQNRRQYRMTQETEIENKFEATFHTACLYRKSTSSSSTTPAEQQETTITTAQTRQSAADGLVNDGDTTNTVVEDTATESISNGDNTAVDGNDTTTDADTVGDNDLPVNVSNPPESTADPQEESTTTNVPVVDPSLEAFEWGVDNCDVEISLQNWADMQDMLSSTLGDGVSRFSTVANNGLAEFLFTVVQRSTTDLSSNSIKFDLNVDGVAAQLSGSDYHLAMFADIKTKQTIEIDGVDSDDESEEGQDSSTTNNNEDPSFVAETGTRTSSEIQDITVPFSSAAVGGPNGQMSPLGHFSWKGEAEATTTVSDPEGTGRRLQVTQPIKVIATIPADQMNQNSQTVAFSFTGPGSVGADYIHWDPEAGVGYRSSSAVLASTVALFVTFATTAIGVFLF